MTWRTRAACLGMDTELFFPENGKYEQAAQVCAGCAVRTDCLNYAMSFDIDLHGMFGGKTPHQRLRLKGTRHDRRFTTWPDQR